MSLGTILIIDDSQIILEATKIVLEDAGYSTVIVSSPFKINAAIRETRPDLILLDVKMPVLSGTKTVQILKQYKLSKDIPILLHSELDASQLQQHVDETGASGFICKKPLGDGLVETLETWLKHEP